MTLPDRLDIGDVILADEASQLLFLRDALYSEDHGRIERAFDLVARAQGLSQMARRAGIKRAALYEAMRRGDRSSISVLSDVVAALTRRQKSRSA